MKKSLSLLVIGLLVLSANVSAQSSRKGKFGLGIDGVESTNMLATYYVSNQFSTDIIAGFDYYSPGADAPSGQTKVDGVNYRVGLDALYHFNIEKVSPYFGVEALFQSEKQGGFYAQEPDMKNSIAAGLVLGAEYFLNDNFSIGIKERVDANFKLSRDIPKEETDTYINTKTQVTGRFYF
jgi:hypothetical protein